MTTLDTSPTASVSTLTGIRLETATLLKTAERERRGGQS